MRIYNSHAKLLGIRVSLTTISWGLVVRSHFALIDSYFLGLRWFCPCGEPARQIGSNCYASALFNRGHDRGVFSVSSFERKKSIQLDCLQSLMRPLVRFCIRHSHSYQDFIKLAKLTFIDVAEEEIRKSTEKVNASRISVLTGIYRREVTKIFRDKEAPSQRPPSLLGRVIGHWEQDKRFLNKSGKPRVLSYQGDESEFAELVGSVSKHINPGTVVFELERTGAAEKTAKGIKLVSQVSGRGPDMRDGFELLAEDVETVMATVEENLFEKKKISNLHLRTEYDNIFVEDLPRVQKWLIEEGKKFHRRARDFLSKHDGDISSGKGSKQGGGRVVLSSFGWTADQESE